jgi:hypothetical protein
MSEYLYVAFRAIDAPVSKQNLEYMHQQSSRAEITPWSFENEYHHGDFHGNALEMLRRGYDVHLEYANYGIRKLMIRFPNGLPDAKAAQAYLEKDGLKFLKDKQGSGGSLCIQPYLEPGDLDELWELDGFFDRLLPLRAELLDGDLRPFYLAHLVVMADGNHDPDEEKEAPIPAGLAKLTAAQLALADFYGLDKSIIEAAARNSPALLKRPASDQHHAAWLQRQPEAAKNAWLHQLMADPHAAVRNEILAAYQKDHAVPSWPTVESDRTISQIKALAGGIHEEMKRHEIEESARQRAKKLADMAAVPASTLRETEELVKQRTSYNYNKIAQLLSDLREALAATDKAGLADEQARALKEQNPTRKLLIAELRKQGFLKK